METRVCNTTLSRFAMSTPLVDMQSRKVWHVCRAYNRCRLLALPSENIVETGGRVLQDAVAKATEHPKPVDAFIRPAHIRFTGGMGTRRAY